MKPQGVYILRGTSSHGGEEEGGAFYHVYISSR